MRREDLKEIVVHFMPSGAEFDESDNLISKGLNSLKIMRISAQLRKKGMKVPFSNLIENPTFGAWLELVQKAGKTPGKNTENKPKAGSSIKYNTSFPLTDVQSAYLIGRSNEQELGGVGCHAYIEIQGEKEIDLEKLKRAWKTVLQHHPMLRAAFNDDMSQKILEKAFCDDIDVVDLREENALEKRIEEIRAKLSHRKLKVEKGEDAGLTVLLLPNGQSRICFDVDLLVADVQSFSIILRDLETAYTGEALPEDSKNFDFAAYLEEQRKREQSDYDAAKEYWGTRIATMPQGPDINLAKHPSQIKATRFTRRKRIVEASKWGAIKEKAGKYETTPAMILLTAYVAVLEKWSSRKSFLINMPVFNRMTEAAGAENAVADFTTLELLEAECLAEDTFETLLRRIEKQLRTDMRYTAYSGMKVLRDISRSNEVQENIAPFVFACNMGSELVDEKFRKDLGSIVYMISQTPQVYLDFQTYENNGDLVMCWDAVDELFRDGMLDKMFAYLANLVEAAGDIPWDEVLQHMNNTDEAQIAAYNSTQADIEPELLHGMFEKCVKENSKKIAVKDASGFITYEELDEKSDAVAYSLVRKGIKIGDNVAVLAERRKETIINILGILKAGAAYVPIDPENPKVRQDDIIANANCSMLLTPEYAVSHAAVAGIELPKQNVNQRAYIIYTSGSTGTPKGVVITHKAASNTIKDINERYSVGKEDVVIGLSSMCFDLSVYDIFGSLAAGATLVMVPEIHDISSIIKLVREEGVTVWNSVPAIAQMMADAMEYEKNNQMSFMQQHRIFLENLRLIIMSGDWIPLNLPERLQKLFPEIELVSMGGATEASIWSIYYPIEEVRNEWKSIPYGMPLANQKIYVLDSFGKICSIDTVGEICIGGVGLASEYYADAEKTAGAFFEHEQLGRLYRTGDYGIFRQEGYVEFLGRRDQQVKIRGHRIELGEIEKACRNIAGIEDTAVLVKADQNQAPMIIAFYVSANEMEQDELKRHIGEYVPEYMVPSVYVRIADIPLTQNGKVDRKKLLSTEVNTVVEEIKPVITETEKTLEKIWCGNIDSLDKVGRNIDFYEAGGDSLSLVRIALAIKEKFGVHCTHSELLDAGTIEKQAKIIEEKIILQNGDKAELQITVNPDRGSFYEPFEFTDIQKAYLMGRSDVFDLGGISTHGYYEYKTSLDMKRLEAAINKVIRVQPMLRAVAVDGERQQFLEQNEPYTIEVIDARQKSQEERERICLDIRREMSAQVLDAYKWPLFAFKAVRITNQESILFTDVDLLIMDAASVRIFKNQIMECYEHDDMELAETEFTFRDFVQGLNQIRTSPQRVIDEKYWKEKARDFAPGAALPLKCEIDQVKDLSCRRLKLNIESDIWSAIKKKIAEKNLSASAVLCTLYLKGLAHYSNQAACSVVMTTFNRYDFHPDVSRLIGDFTSTMLVGSDFSDARFWEAAKQVRNDIMNGLEHRTYSGTEFTKDLRSAGVLSGRTSIPVVFTSTLINDKGDAEAEFGEEIFSVSQTSQVYLDCQVMEKNGRLQITWDYMPELLDDVMMSEMFEGFETAIRSIADGNETPDVCYGNVSRMNRLAKLYNNTCAEIPTATLHGMFAKQARKTPDAVAVSDVESGYTYRELDVLSDKIAAFLQLRGVKPGNNVGVLAQRRIGTIAEILGILKAGAAYVPIDPENPASRQKEILKTADCVQFIDNTILNELEEADVFQAVDVDCYDRAYIIFTSGSTGVPKGVVIRHDAAANTIQDINERFKVTGKDKIIGLSSMCFDLSVYDIFGALSCGAELIMVPDIHNMSQIADMVKERGATLWNSVPAVMQMYVEELRHREKMESEQDASTSLRLVMLSGDYIPLSLPEAINSRIPKAEIVSLGGATEASIWSIYYPVSEVKETWKTIPYGMPLSNQEFYVLNYDLSFTPQDVVGELYIGGRGLSDGYYGDEAKTDAAYISHPQLGRIYKTGDYGIFHAEGYIEFVGRKDNQVKIRGHRVELGEIEGAMRKLAGIRNAAAIIKKKNEAPIIVGFVIADIGINAETIKKQLKDYLPAYMIPSIIEQINEIPVTRNGKVDRKMLAEYETSYGEEEGVSAPETETEQFIAELWRENIEEIESVYRDSDFYEVGGDSVVLFKIITAIEEKYSMKLDVSDMMSLETLKDMAAYVDEKIGA